MPPTFLKGSISALIICAATAPGVFSANATADGLSAGFDAIAGKDYPKALTIFNIAARQHPDDPEVHFGRGITFQKLGRSQDAVKEFKLALLFNPPTNVKVACQKELDFLQLQPPNPAPQTITPRDIEQASLTITKQSEACLQQIRSRYIASMQRPFSPYYMSLSSGAYPTAYSVGPSYPVYPGGMPGPIGCGIGRPLIGRPLTSLGPYSQLPFPSYGNYADYQSRYTDAQRRSQAIADAAEGLRSAMSQKPTNGVYLTPIGTNLYVRNYVMFDTPKPPEVQALMATAQRYHAPTKNHQ